MHEHRARITSDRERTNLPKLEMNIESYIFYKISARLSCNMFVFLSCFISLSVDILSLDLWEMAKRFPPARKSRPRSLVVSRNLDTGVSKRRRRGVTIQRGAGKSSWDKAAVCRFCIPVHEGKKHYLPIRLPFREAKEKSLCLDHEF